MKSNKQIVTIVISAALLTGGAAFGQSGEAILDLLTKKGVITTNEANAAREQFDKQTAETINQYNKIKLSSWVNSLQFYGDGRLRYDWRSGSGNAAGIGTYDNADFDRFRYRLRVGVVGEYQDNFSYGLRLETGTKGDSANSTMGGGANANTSIPGVSSGGPWGKAGSSTIGVGQFWAQYKPADWLTLIGGKIENPFISTKMVWSENINPEGFAEKLKFKTAKVDWFLTLGEFTYSNLSNQNNFASLAGVPDAWMLGAQGGGKVKFTKDVSLTLAPTFYTYSNPLGASGGAHFSPTLVAGNIYAINNLNVFDLPAELAFPIGKYPGKIFGDFAINLTANTRAADAGWSADGNQGIAYQVGAAIGDNKKKHDWLLKAYWQHSELFALDPNLVDTDVFDTRLNMQGEVVSSQYLFTDYLSLVLTYNHGDAINSALPTLTGAGDLRGNLRNYNLMQLDLNWKF